MRISEKEKKKKKEVALVSILCVFFSPNADFSFKISFDAKM